MSTDAALVNMVDERQRLVAKIRDLHARVDVLTAEIAEAMPDKVVTIDELGLTIERHRATRYTQWDTEQLLPHVLDTRRIDESTGEIKDETPLDKVLHVWNLGAPRVTALRERGLDPDEYAQHRPAGWSLRVYQPDDKQPRDENREAE